MLRDQEGRLWNQTIRPLTRFVIWTKSLAFVSFYFIISNMEWWLYLFPKLVWELSELVHGKHLKQCQARNKHIINFLNQLVIFFSSYSCLYKSPFCGTMQASFQKGKAKRFTSIYCSCDSFGLDIWRRWRHLSCWKPSYFPTLRRHSANTCQINQGTAW